jgi:hypothetical protein
MKRLGNKGETDVVKLLLVLLLIGFIFGLPVWPYSHSWGIYPGGFVGILLLIVVLKLIGAI